MPNLYLPAEVWIFLAQNVLGQRGRVVQFVLVQGNLSIVKGLNPVALEHNYGVGMARGKCISKSKSKFIV